MQFPISIDVRAAIQNGEIPIERCPHCSIASPRMSLVWSERAVTRRSLSAPNVMWAAFQCGSCGGVISVCGDIIEETSEIYPETIHVSEALPKSTQKYLEQAYASRSSPDAVVLLCASAVDSMLKEKGLSDGTLFHRIEEAKESNLITSAMAEWANEVRLQGNSTRHSDVTEPHASIKDAERSLLFAEALGYYLFILPSMVFRGRSNS